MTLTAIIEAPVLEAQDVIDLELKEEAVLPKKRGRKPKDPNVESLASNVKEEKPVEIPEKVSERFVWIISETSNLCLGQRVERQERAVRSHLGCPFK